MRCRGREAKLDEMYRGAFALIDALGIRGNRHPNLIPKFVMLRESFEEYLASQLGGRSAAGKARKNSQTSHRVFAGTGHPRNLLKAVSFGFLSDTVFLGVVHKSSAELQSGASEEMLDAFAVNAAARFIANAIRLAARGEPAWAYRGAIAVGDFETEPSSSFFVGPAVDEAAECMNAAQGGFVWVTPRARSIVVAANAGTGGSPLTQWRVPLKGRGELDTFVVSPFEAQNAADRRQTLSDILATFNRPTLDVAIKKQNTERFLLHDLERRVAQ
jgi:hypothetical protein